MTTHRQILIAFGILVALTAGCGDGDEPTADDIGSDELALISANGISVNGISVNGISVNGISVNGISVNGVSITGVTLSATKFSGTKSGQPISGAGFVGSKFVGTKADGTSITLRVDTAALGTGANSDVWMYGMSYQSGTTWVRMCGSDTSGNQILAIPANGIWDYRSGVTGGGAWSASSTSFTFGCRTAALAKCVEMGYKPWKTLPNGTGSLLNHHLACVRMIRADYCGDGKAWTVNGNQINVYDGVGIQADAAAWSMEAEWTQTGARCVTPLTDTRLKARGAPPTCFPTKILSTCGQLSRFGSGTLLMSEVP